VLVLLPLSILLADGYFVLRHGVWLVLLMLLNWITAVDALVGGRTPISS
jgi:hypothetical protein